MKPAREPVVDRPSGTQGPGEKREVAMLSWSLAFFIIAIIAAVFGFGGIASGAADIARLCFFFFLVVFAVTLVYGLVTGRKPPDSLT